MKAFRSAWIRWGWVAALALPACQPSPQRLEQLEAVQQQQARELARLRQTLAERDEEIAQLEDCVDNLESAVYEDEDSTAYEDDGARRSVQL